MNKTFILTIFTTNGVEPQQEYRAFASAESVAEIYKRMDKTTEISIDLWYTDPNTFEEKTINRYHWKK